MKTNKTFISTTKKIILSALVVCALVFSSLGLSSLFGTNTAKAATYELNKVNESLETKYLAHWSNGQGQRVSGETSGRWYFGYGDVNNGVGGYSFTQASFDSTQESKPYTTGFSHQMHWRFNVSTRAYSSASTQTMFVWEAEHKGTVSFSGLFSKATSDKQVLGGTQNNVDTLHIAGINWVETAFNWVDGQDYTCGMFKVDGSTGEVTTVTYQNYTSEYVWLVPQASLSCNAGDKFVFGLKCNNANGDEWLTNTLGFFSSSFIEDTSGGESGGEVTPPVVDPIDPSLPDTIPDITAPSSGFEKIAHYEFKDSTDLGKDSTGNYNLTNRDLEKGTDGVALNGTASAEKFMYAPKVAQNGADFSDAVKGSFSLSFKIYAKKGAENDGEHVILTTGDGVEGFEILWKTQDLVVKANGQEYRIDNAIVEDEFGQPENVYMLDEKASWYRYTIIYDETDPENIFIQIRVDRFNDEGTMYGDMTVITKKKLKEKVSFGGSVDYTFAIGANTTFGTYNTNFTQGYDLNNQTFAPILSDLRIYSGAISKDEIISVWQDDEGENYRDRDAAYQLTIENGNGGTISGAKNVTYGDGTILNITVTPSAGWKIKSVKWNTGSQDVEVDSSQYTGDLESGITFTKEIRSNCILKVEYEELMCNVTVKANGKIDTILSKLYPALSTLNIQITPDAGNEIDSVKWNGVEISDTYNAFNKNGFMFEQAVTEDSVLEITYVKKSYSVLFKIDGTTDRSLTKKANMNDNITISVEAPSGKRIKSIKFGRENIEISDENATSIEFTRKVTGATTVAIEFEIAEEKPLGCAGTVMPVYAISALIIVAGAILLVKKAKKSK